MFQNSIAIKNKHKKFIQECTENEFVWGLRSEAGYASSSSTEFDDEDGEPIGIICFWSDEKMANVCAKKHWNEYSPSKIGLAEFLENWCIGMHNKYTLAGTNFDWNLYGTEIEPLELLIEITKVLQEKNKELVFRNFDGIRDLENQVQNILNGGEEEE